MQPPLTVVAEMIDGTCLVEHVATFAAFVGIVLPLRRDSECLRVTWHPTPEPPEDDERMYESAGACPWNQSTLAEAEYQRWQPAA